MKKKIAALAMVVICLSMAAYGTLAYFTHEDDATNVITAGNIRIAVEELSEAEDGSLVPFSEITDAMPGMEASQIVRVKNVGAQSAWVRVSTETVITLAEGMEGQVDASLVSLNLNTEDWTEQDGYYYYNKPLKAGETTQPLFTTVSFSVKMSNLYQHCKVAVEVCAQATQEANNGETVLEAAGWPANN